MREWKSPAGGGKNAPELIANFSILGNAIFRQEAKTRKRFVGNIESSPVLII
jgi:hypothetical protein